jgi:hypothetical protein
MPSSPELNSPVIAMLGSIFYRIDHCLRMMSGTISLIPRERERCYPQMQINQWLEERLVLVCKTCGKKWFKAIYLINSLI